MQARILESLVDVSPTDWDSLHDGRNPFVRHRFLAGLEAHGCVRPEWGWSPRHLTLWEGGTLVGAAPAYLKANSHGEFVFDHAWARAYAQHGHDYFPKWLCAVPYSPVTGPRLLARDDASRPALLAVLARAARDSGLSSVHVNFHDAAEAGAFDERWLERVDVQYHWSNPQGWREFTDFLAALDHRHRKNIRQERAKVARAGVDVRVVEGRDASRADLAVMHRFYLSTFDEYGNHAALTLPFFEHLADSMPETLVLILAERDGRPIAGALCLRGGDTLYGRYWGTIEQVPGLHFELCYYQGIEYCLRSGLTRFEPGAQGEHKLARGFLPTFVRSRHWIAEDAFHEALAPWCEAERRSVESYAAALQERSPFKAPSPDADPTPRPAG